MILTDNEKGMSVKFMADPALLQVYYYLHTITAGNGMVRTTLRELEIGTGLDKMKIKRRLDLLALNGDILVIKSDRNGTMLALGNEHYFDKQILEIHREAIQKNSSEAYKRIAPEEWAMARML